MYFFYKNTLFLNSENSYNSENSDSKKGRTPFTTLSIYFTKTFFTLTAMGLTPD